MSYIRSLQVDMWIVDLVLNIKHFEPYTRWGDAAAGGQLLEGAAGGRSVLVGSLLTPGRPKRPLKGALSF